MPVEPATTAAYRRQMQARSADREVAGLAGRQCGVVSRAQLIGIGLSESAIERRIWAGRLHTLHPGVYAVGHRSVPLEGLWLAAVLRGGEGAVLSHRSAAALWGIRRGDLRARIEIATPRATRSCGRIHRRCLQLAPAEVTIRKRIPVTTLARTLLDIAATLSAEGMEAAIREAEYQHRFHPRALAEMLERHPGQRGAATVRSCLHSVERGPRGRVRSELEVRFAALLARTDLPRPRLNAELDLDGWRVIRVTWRQLDNPAALLRDLRNLLNPHI